MSGSFKVRKIYRRFTSFRQGDFMRVASLKFLVAVGATLTPLILPAAAQIDNVNSPSKGTAFLYSNNAFTPVTLPDFPIVFPTGINDS